MDVTVTFNLPMEGDKELNYKWGYFKNSDKIILLNYSCFPKCTRTQSQKQKYLKTYLY